MTAPTAQMMMDLTPANANLVPPVVLQARCAKSRITLVEVITRDASWYEKRYTDVGEWTRQVIAVFRDDSRMYRGYEYRGGLRHERLLRIIGRH